MVTTHNLGFPRIGSKRELKFALENYWRDKCSVDDLNAIAYDLRQTHWRYQSKLDFVPIGDFSFYDQVLDTSFMLGHLPERARHLAVNELDRYFYIARGRSTATSVCNGIPAAEMTKWFDTNYHYIVPEFEASTRFTLNPGNILSQIKEARHIGHTPKPVIIGPVTYLWLGKCKHGTNKLHRLDELIVVYEQLLNLLSEHNIEWVQLDEPILVTQLNAEWYHALRTAYHSLNRCPIKILLASYFGKLQENLQLICELPVHGLHFDAINNSRNELNQLIDWWPTHKVLSLGVINGRNIWKTNLSTTLDWLETVHERIGQQLWLAPSCSLLHVPVDLNNESGFDKEVLPWMAFAVQKLEELHVMACALNSGRHSVAQQLAQNAADLASRNHSKRVNNPAVKQRIAAINKNITQRRADYVNRSALQQRELNLPAFPTTSIGSFPQTATIRQLRKKHKNGEMNQAHYDTKIQKEIARCIHEQEALDLDVLVHGEPERNDMVEYFGEQLHGYVFSQSGWVQSYGSRCVKPPIIYGDISRPQAMTVDWIKYASSLTDKPVKGMLTGPVTMLNWSFVRDDQPREKTCMQLAFALRDEVLDLEKSGVRIIQIDEAALREGLPLRKSQWQTYLDWAIKAFQITANGVSNETQIHTHMCYSDFNDIITAIAAMDADVITIETSRSHMELLSAFDTFNYPNAIGPGVYDIHSPNIPSVDAMVALLKNAATRIPPTKLWVNPDCGLKTRNWEEVKPALSNMVKAAKQLRLMF